MSISLSYSPNWTRSEQAAQATSHEMVKEKEKNLFLNRKTPHTHKRANWMGKKYSFIYHNETVRTQPVRQFICRLYFSPKNFTFHRKHRRPHSAAGYNSVTLKCTFYKLPSFHSIPYDTASSAGAILENYRNKSAPHSTTWSCKIEGKLTRCNTHTSLIRALNSTAISFIYAHGTGQSALRFKFGKNRN